MLGRKHKPRISTLMQHYGHTALHSKHPWVTPLVYGQEAILPIEVELSSLRVMVQHEDNPKEKLN